MQMTKRLVGVTALAALTTLMTTACGDDTDDGPGLAEGTESDDGEQTAASDVAATDDEAEATEATDTANVDAGADATGAESDSGQSDGEEPAPDPRDGWPASAALDSALETYADIVHASYEDTLEGALALQNAVEDFLAEPSAEALERARGAWRESREPYLQTEVYRFYEGPIDAEGSGPEAFLNAWPLDEAHIDYVASSAGAVVEGDSGVDAGAWPGIEVSGLINDEDFEIDAANLMAQNERGGEKNISTGYHAIEFLLWGQDWNADGPGERPYTDFIEGEDATAPNGARRREYLSVVTELLVESLQPLVEAWAPDEDNYRAEFVQGGSASLQKILTGMIVLSGFETGGERLQAALDALDQEEEHSCFSDNTHRDMVGDAQGVLNVLSGSYQRTDGSLVEGTAIVELIAENDPELAEELEARALSSVELAEALQPPFDREIAPGNDEGHARVQALIDSLFEQEELLTDVFHGYGFDVPQPE